MFPLSAFDMFSDPDQTPTARKIAALVLSQQHKLLRLRYLYSFRGSIAYLQQSLSTLRANISIDYARLASDGWLSLFEQDWLPVGKLRGVSLLSILVRQINPHLMGFARRDYVPVIKLCESNSILLARGGQCFRFYHRTSYLSRR